MRSDDDDDDFRKVPALICHKKRFLKKFICWKLIIVYLVLYQALHRFLICGPSQSKRFERGLYRKSTYSWCGRTSPHNDQDNV